MRNPGVGGGWSSAEVRGDLATRKVLPLAAIFYVAYFDNPFDLFQRWSHHGFHRTWPRVVASRPTPWRHGISLRRFEHRYARPTACDRLMWCKGCRACLHSDNRLFSITI